VLRVFPNSRTGKRAMSKVENLEIDRRSIKVHLRRFHELELELGYEKQESLFLVQLLVSRGVQNAGKE
jgi:hypothetical protein